MKVHRILTFVFLAAAMLPLYAGLEAAEGEGDAAKKKVLYVFAHQDDEICIAARMKADVLAGNEMSVIWITNGDKAGDPFERESESRAAMEFLGVPEQNLHFLGYEDSYSYRSIIPAYEKTLEMAKRMQPDEIFSNAYEGGNIDHDTVHFIANMVSRVLENRPPHYEFPLYNSYNGTYQVSKFIPRDDTEQLSTSLNREMAEAKIGIMKMYPTQNALLVPLSRLVSKKHLRKYGEPYRLVPEYNYLEPPTEGILGYEMNKRRPHKFEEFRESVELFLASPAAPKK